jgi:phage gp36-like protein
MTLPCSYTTTTAVLAAYPPIGSVTTVSSAHIAAAIGAQQAMIDAKLAARYDVPFAAVPPIIESITTDLSVHQLLTQRVFTGERANKSEWPDAWLRSADLLDALAVGSATLVTGSGTVLATRDSPAQGLGEVWSSTLATTPTMNRGAWQAMGDLGRW